jgi:ParB family chromosome partitioning protein
MTSAKGERRRKALGRGLSNLIPTTVDENAADTDTAVAQQGVSYITVSSINPNPFQPRKQFSENEIDELAESIRHSGLLQPVLLRKKEDGYEIISGERRFRAVKKLGKKKVAASVKTNISNRRMIEMALIENVQREDLNEIEKAHTYQQLLTEHGLSHEQLSQQVGKSRSVITNSLRMLKLPSSVQDMVSHHQISSGHARALLALSDPQRQAELAQRIYSERLSVREVEQLVTTQDGGTRKKKEQKTQTTTAIDRFIKDPDVAAYLDSLEKKFGTSVSVASTKKNRGKLQIEFYGKEDLGRILGILAG